VWIVAIRNGEGEGDGWDDVALSYGVSSSEAWDNVFSIKTGEVNFAVFNQDVG